MDDELAFLKAIQAEPTDTTAKLVYADWLEERGENEKAEWLRTVVTKPVDNDKFSWFQEYHDPWKSWVLSDFHLWDYTTAVALGQLQTALRVYAALNDNSSDISAFFYCTLVPKNNDLLSIAQKLSSSELLPRRLMEMSMDGYYSETHSMIDKFLLYEIRNINRRDNEQELMLSTPSGRAGHTRHVMNLIHAILKPTTGWHVRYDPRPESEINKYPGFWGAELLLEDAHRVLFLGLTHADSGGTFDYPDAD
jgi:uncharacterized protein (TIGR02996 family)